MALDPKSVGAKGKPARRSWTSKDSLLYAVGGFHIATVGVGMVFVALMAFRALGGQYSGRDSEGLAAAAVFWDAAVAVYLVSWLAVYVTK